MGASALHLGSPPSPARRPDNRAKCRDCQLSGTEKERRLQEKSSPVKRLFHDLSRGRAHSNDVIVRPGVSSSDADGLPEGLERARESSSARSS